MVGLCFFLERKKYWRNNDRGNTVIKAWILRHALGQSQNPPFSNSDLDTQNHLADSTDRLEGQYILPGGNNWRRWFRCWSQLDHPWERPGPNIAPWKFPRYPRINHCHACHRTSLHVWWVLFPFSLPIYRGWHENRWFASWNRRHYPDPACYIDSAYGQCSATHCCVPYIRDFHAISYVDGIYARPLYLLSHALLTSFFLGDVHTKVIHPDVIRPIHRSLYQCTSPLTLNFTLRSEYKKRLLKRWRTRIHNFQGSQRYHFSRILQIIQDADQSAFQKIIQDHFLPSTPLENQIATEHEVLAFPDEMDSNYSEHSILDDTDSGFIHIDKENYSVR